jgi:hypothetical protein
VIVPAWAYLSRLLWLLGYPQQAEEAGRDSGQKAREIGQPNRLAFALYSELVRRGLFEADPANALPLADEIMACCQQRHWWRIRRLSDLAVVTAGSGVRADDAGRRVGGRCHVAAPASLAHGA